MSGKGKSFVSISAQKYAASKWHRRPIQYKTLHANHLDGQKTIDKKVKMCNIYKLIESIPAVLTVKRCCIIDACIYINQYLQGGIFMRQILLVIAAIISLLGCSSSTDNYKYADRVEIMKDGSIKLIGEHTDEGKRKGKHFKVFCNKDGQIVRYDFYDGATMKRYAKCIYNKQGKISEVRHFDGRKYNGVSKYVYGEDGAISREVQYDQDFNFVYSKSF